MKLRNKKTGEIKSITEIIREAFLSSELDALKNIADSWEDVDGTNATNPIIKDEKIRKAVRAWAEALNADAIRFERFSQGFSFGDGNVYSSINFDGCVFDLADGKEYTITELCGSEDAKD